ncbi:hypothetical protein ADK38_29090 [Streptomyces varsoviensis]|uniref:DNA-binding domain-containing protein n=1 Tax=Streptomyces varsoviensis TaxID=67373 RepID=A0ABR5J036_9ACTN|nr:hypothetical protein ADK38_29090 [Streptomyces varsoviensis]
MAKTSGVVEVSSLHRTEVFVSHRNARLTVHGRRLLVDRVCAGRPVAHVAAEMGVSRVTVHKWVRRWRSRSWATDRLPSRGPVTDQKLHRVFPAMRAGRWAELTRWSGSYWVVASERRQHFVCGGLVGIRAVCSSPSEDGTAWASEPGLLECPLVP